MTYKELELLEKKESLERELISVQEELESIKNKKYIGQWFMETRPKPFSDTTYICIEKVDSTDGDNIYGEGKGVFINNIGEIAPYNGEVDLKNCIKTSKEEILKNMTKMINNWVKEAEENVLSLSE